MKSLFRTTVPVMALSALLVTGCGPANEEGIEKASAGKTTEGNAPQYKSYKEFAEAQAEASKKKGEEHKGAKGAQKSK
jgi:hypothetical protein